MSNPRSVVEARKASHTPGPWIADDLFMKDGNVVRISAYDGTPDYYHRCVSIAECDVRADRHDKDSPHILQAEANARLIACAPELLEIVRELCQYAGGMEYDTFRMFTERAAAVLAKAEGRS